MEVSVHWDLWRHLFRGKLYTEFVSAGVRRPVRAGGLTHQVRGTRKEDYIPCRITTTNSDWDRGWFYLRNDDRRLSAYSGKVLLEKQDTWVFGVTPPEHQARLEVYTSALRCLANKGLTAAVVITRFLQWRVLPLMERKLPLFGMTKDAAFEGTRMAAEPLSQEVTSQRAIWAVSHPAGGHEDLWRLPMRPDKGYIQVVSFISKP